MQFVRIEMQELTKEGSVKKGGYQLDPLPKPSVDTGMGLERLCVVLQGVKSNYETDLLKNLVEFTAQLAVPKGDLNPWKTSRDMSSEAITARLELVDQLWQLGVDEQKQFACRVIADHARATAFSIADGILPGNEGRNYVIRKIMRRAIYQGRHTLGFEGSFFHKVTNFVVDQMGEAYPELEASRGFIEKMVKL